ncbi:class I SAM-dependent methyltransferase [Nocardioides sp. B-3]|uniref:class I SAM-dependent methyltransferase n=1 Tax=Nocardioides sp. B-3 TaxID=2895565 RepID=UPI00215370FB|nr:class I SAM-dependent methyltransferase [Nocardioides sp. B-3]UUZ58767.1 class I SAM-dependent methyltransferase [Nocardioides sp. B-3]
MPQPIAPDTKDWTRVLEQPCAECGFDPSAQTLADLPGLIHDTAMAFSQVVRRPDVRERPAPKVWSPLEYACHVRDVHRLFAERVELMLREDEPTFANWDQGRDGDRVEVLRAGPARGRRRSDRGRRSRRRALLHGHRRHRGSPRVPLQRQRLHGRDARALPPARRGPPRPRRRRMSTSDTVRAYDLDAAAYAANGASMPDSVRRDLEAFAERLGAGARVLEIGSGGGRDARLLEEHGLRVRRTDITPGFVALLRAEGHDADLLDPLTDDLSTPEGPYAAVWANASLLHVARADLPVVLARLAAVVRPDGLLRISVKAGDGEGWSTHGSIGNPRHFTYWRADPLRNVVAGAGWRDVEITHEPGTKNAESWLEVSAVRA